MAAVLEFSFLAHVADTPAVWTAVVVGDVQTHVISLVMSLFNSLRPEGGNRQYSGYWGAYTGVADSISCES